MQTKLHDNLVDLPIVSEANEILRSCVRCGFCTAVCPTYQTLGDELDGPRGRIYLIKNLLEEDQISSQANKHLDRCLTCRACETACPSGVKYGRLLDIGREIIATRYTFGLTFEKGRRALIVRFLRQFIPRQRLFKGVLLLGQLIRPILPAALAKNIPAKVTSNYLLPERNREPEPNKLPERNREPERHSPTVSAAEIKTGKILLLQGCVQKAATPNVNKALEYLLARKQVEVEYLNVEGCCGALDYHLAAHSAALKKIRQLIDNLMVRLSKVDWIVSSASGCGVTIKDYPEIMQYDPVYADKAKQVAARVLDVSQLLNRFDFQCKPLKVAVHTPCSLQHGQKLPVSIEQILVQAGADLVATGEKHLCCGSAGTYSILQPSIANELTKRKVSQLTFDNPDVIVTANIGCQLQLAANAEKPVQHWVEFLADNILPDDC
ncbi:MAG: glycolate oxidase subunit GlcF [Pseudomonadales bacterium]|nr:glycolate oxidase subunit GlcF [Pseudomonadales bacterium]